MQFRYHQSYLYFIIKEDNTMKGTRPLDNQEIRQVSGSFDRPIRPFRRIR